MRVSLKKSVENKVMVGLIVILSLLLAVFFTSKMWMFDDDPIKQTPFNQIIPSLDQTDIQLKRWRYNEQEKFMEVIIEKKHRGSDIIKPTFKYRGKHAEVDVELETKIVYETETIAVIELHNIPEKFKYITLAMDEYRDEETVRIEKKDSNLDVDEVLKPKRFVFVGDYRKIELDNDLATREQNEYQKENIEIEIEQLIHEISYIQKEVIPLKEKSLVQLEKDIQSIENEKEFSTEEEQDALDRDIYSKKMTIKKELEEITLLNEKISNIEKKIKSLEDKIDFLDGKIKKKEEDSSESEDELEADESVEVVEEITE